MKKLQDYIFETAKKYEYRVKIAGDLPEGFIDEFKKSLGAFDVAECSAITKTPIQSDPFGFPGIKNESVNMFDVSLNYPASTQQLIEMARLHGVTPSNIIVVDKAFNDSMIVDMNGNNGEAVLATPDYPATTKEQKDLKDDYADSYQKAAAAFANKGHSEFEIAGKEKTPTAFSTDSKSGGEKSPLSSIKRKSVEDMLRK